MSSSRSRERSIASGRPALACGSRSSENQSSKSTATVRPAQEIERDRKRLLGMGDVEIGRVREGGAPQGGVRISQLPAVFGVHVAVQQMRHLASRSGEQTDSFAHREIQHRYKGKGNGLDDLLIVVLQNAIEPRAQP